MKLKAFLFIITFAFLPVSFLYSQNDSLEQSLKNGKIDTNRVRVLNQLFLNYEFQDTAKAFGYVRQALALAQKLSYKRGEGVALQHTGFSKEDFGNYDGALIYYTKAKKVFSEIGDAEGTANAINSVAGIYMAKAMYPEALASYDEAMAFYKKQKNNKGIGSVYNNYGIVYDAMGDYKKATENYIKAITQYEKTNFKVGIAAIYCNLGVIFQAQQNWEMAIDYHNKSIAICKEIGHRQFEANNYNDMADIYSAKNDLKTSLDYNLKALKIRKEIGDQFGIGSTVSNIGGIYANLDSLKQSLVYLDEAEKILRDLGAKKFYVKNIITKAEVLIKLKRFPEAEKYVKEALELSKETDLNDELKNAYLTATNLYDQMGNAPKALSYSKLYIAIQDSVFSRENRKTIAELERKYQSEKKDTEIRLLNQDKDLKQKEIERSNMIRNSLLAGVVLILLLLGVSVKAFLAKKESNRIITTQKNVVEEKQKEILDSIHYASRIQQAMLTSESYFEEHLGTDYFIFYQPKDIVSGDFYWSVSHHDKFYMATADCTGHGVPGAFMSLLNISFLNENVVGREIKDPAKILDEQRKQIIKALNPKGTENSKDGMDCVLCAFDLKGSNLEFSAANNPLWLVRNNELREYKADKMPVGKGEDNAKNFTTQSIELQKGDVIYTFTDGYADQFGGPKGKKFMYRQLNRLLMEHHLEPMKLQKEVLAKTINDWKGSNEQVDDILVIGVRVG